MRIIHGEIAKFDCALASCMASTFEARSRTVRSSGFPILIGVFKCSDGGADNSATMPEIDPTRSKNCESACHHRKRSMDCSASDCTMKFETTRPSFGRIRGPYVLKMRTILRVHPVITAIGHCHCFSKSLRFVINAARPDRIHVAPICFLLWIDERIAVNFRRARQKKTRLFRFARPMALWVPSEPTFNVWIGISR